MSDHMMTRIQRTALIPFYSLAGDLLAVRSYGLVEIPRTNEVSLWVITVRSVVCKGPEEVYQQVFDNVDNAHDRYEDILKCDGLLKDVHGFPKRLK